MFGMGDRQHLKRNNAEVLEEDNDILAKRVKSGNEKDRIESDLQKKYEREMTAPFNDV